jgi:acyl-CoA thioester hydrolase
VVDVIDRLDYSAFAVLSDYLDANGHMNVGYYTLLFDKALDLPWAALGLYSQMLLKSGRSTFALECHLTYQRELMAGSSLRFGFHLLDYDGKRVHYFMQMFHATENFLAATCEQLSICMDMNARRSAAWTQEQVALLDALHLAHRQRPRPAEVGRIVGIRRK